MRRLIFAFVKKELVQTLRDPRMKILLFVTPMVQMAIFGLALDIQIKNIKLYARPMMNDRLLEDVKRNALASKWFIPVKEKESIGGTDISGFRSGDLDVALYPPEGGLTQKFEDNKGELEAVIDGSDLVRARGINGYISQIVDRTVQDRLGRTRTYSFDIEAETNRDTVSKLPIEFDTRLLYNPELASAYSLVPGVLSMLMCIVTIMLTSMSLAKEKEIGTFEMLISAPVTVKEILLGKTIPFLIIGCINLPLIFSVAVLGFGVPMRGSYFWLAIATVFFLISTVSIGTTLSTIAKNQQQAMMGSFIFLMPAIMLSGTMFPLDNMPVILKAISYINPVMYYSVLIRNIMLKGGNHTVLLIHTCALFLIAVVSSSIAFNRFKLHLG